MIPPILISKLVPYFTPEPPISAAEAYIYAAIFSLINFVRIFVVHHDGWGLQRIGMQIRVATTAIAFRKVSTVGQFEVKGHFLSIGG